MCLVNIKRFRSNTRKARRFKVLQVFQKKLYSPVMNFKWEKGKINVSDCNHEQAGFHIFLDLANAVKFKQYLDEEQNQFEKELVSHTKKIHVIVELEVINKSAEGITRYGEFYREFECPGEAWRQAKIIKVFDDKELPKCEGQEGAIICKEEE